MDIIDKLTEAIVDGSIKMKKYNKEVKALNKTLKQYNIKLKDDITKGTKEQIASQCLYMHADDMFENIEGGLQNAN